MRRAVSRCPEMASEKSTGQRLSPPALGRRVRSCPRCIRPRDWHSHPLAPAGLNRMTLTDPRLAYGSLPVLIWTARADGSCDYLNERWKEFTGRPVADMLGWAWLDGVHPDDRERVIAEYSGAVAA